jgi:hypothetical protein
MLVAVGRRRRGLFDGSSDWCGLIFESVMGELWTNSLHHLANLLKSCCHLYGDMACKLRMWG